MYLSRFGAKNYKCLGEIDIPLTPIHVLIGQNDSGKTSLLEAMEAFFASADKSINQVFPEPWTGRELVRHASAEPRVELWGECGSHGLNDSDTPEQSLRYGFSLEFPLRGHTCGVTDQWSEIGGKRRPMWPSSSSIDETLIKYWKSHTELPVPDTVLLEDVKSVAEVLEPARKYALDAKLMAVPAVVDTVRKFRLDPDGFGLATLLNDIVSYDPELFLKLRADFCRFFPQFKGIHTETVQAWKRTYNPSGIHVSSSTDGTGIFFDTITGQKVRAQQASDGAILFLAFLALAYSPEPPGILLIEEPENGVYPTRLGQIIKLLKDMVNRTDGVRFPQIIMTTHSPYLLSFFEPEEVTLLSRPAEPADAPVRARPLRDAPNIRERMGDEFYLGELWYNLSEEDLFGDA